jgi:hypothetical protein
MSKSKCARLPRFGVSLARTQADLNGRNLRFAGPVCRSYSRNRQKPEAARLGSWSPRSPIARDRGHPHCALNRTPRPGPPACHANYFLLDLVGELQRNSAAYPYNQANGEHGITNDEIAIKRPLRVGRPIRVDDALSDLLNCIAPAELIVRRSISVQDATHSLHSEICNDNAAQHQKHPQSESSEQDFIKRSHYCTPPGWRGFRARSCPTSMILGVAATILALPAS